MDLAAWEAHFRAFPPVVAVEIVRLWRESTEGLAAHLAKRFPWAFELLGLDPSPDPAVEAPPAGHVADPFAGEYA